MKPSDGEDDEDRKNRHVRYFYYFIGIAIVVAAVIAVTLYFVYRPSLPEFSIQALSIYDINVHSTSAPVNQISINTQFTIVVHNPNDRTSITHDRLVVFLTYHNHPITPPTPLLPIILREKTTVAASPVVGGGLVSVPKEVAAGLANEKSVGVMGMKVIVMGRVKYSSIPFQSRWYEIHVGCGLLVGMKKGFHGSVSILGNPICHVSI